MRVNLFDPILKHSRMKFKNVLTVEDKLHIYRVMKKIRLFEKAFYQLITQGFVFGSTHFYIGQEEAILKYLSL